MAAANNSLKNNRSLLSKRKEKRTLSGSYANVEMKKFPEATPEKLKAIKRRLQIENKQSRMKLFIGFIISCLVLVILLYFIT